MQVDFGVSQMNKQQKIFKITGLLLNYPQEEWIENLETIEMEINSLKDASVNSYFQSFAKYLTATTYADLCERYVKTFDFYGVSTLNLTYNVFKDSRERGNALVQLREIFSQSQFYPLTDELPDYVPLILEFLSICETELADQLIKIHYKSFVKLEQDLMENDSPYQFLMKIVVYLISERLKTIKAS